MVCCGDAIPDIFAWKGPPMSFRLFAEQALADFSSTAAVAPSSPQLVSAMLEPLPMARARVVVELGPGTGAMTEVLLKELPPQATLLVFETNRRFIEYLQKKLPDPRLILINAPAESLGPEIRRRGFDRVDAVVSSLGLGFMSAQQHHKLFSEILPFLHEKSVLTQYQYLIGLNFSKGRLSHLNLPKLLGRYFRSVRSKIVWRNLPPAFVFTCRV
jgi:phosphatidylethanolamine/phosphatidyl-N-methylethanolamine N-methyltransferase